MNSRQSNFLAIILIGVLAYVLLFAAGCQKPPAVPKPAPGEPLAAASQAVESVRAHLKAVGHDDMETNAGLNAVNEQIAKGVAAAKTQKADDDKQLATAQKQRDDARGEQQLVGALYTTLPIAVIAIAVGSVLIYLTFAKWGTACIVGGVVEIIAAIGVVETVKYVDLVVIPLAVTVGVLLVVGLIYAAYWLVRTIRAQATGNVGELTHPVIHAIGAKLLASRPAAPVDPMAV